MLITSDASKSRTRIRPMERAPRRFLVTGASQTRANAGQQIVRSTSRTNSLAKKFRGRGGSDAHPAIRRKKNVASSRLTDRWLPLDSKTSEFQTRNGRRLVWESRTHIHTLLLPFCAHSYWTSASAPEQFSPSPISSDPLGREKQPCGRRRGGGHVSGETERAAWHI